MALSPDVAAALLPQEALTSLGEGPGVQVVPTSGQVTRLHHAQALGMEASASAVVTVTRSVRGSPGLSTARVMPTRSEGLPNPQPSETSAQGLRLADIHLLPVEPSSHAHQPTAEPVTAGSCPEYPATHVHLANSGQGQGGAASVSYGPGISAPVWGLDNDQSNHMAAAPVRAPHMSPQQVLPEATLMLARDRLQALVSAAAPVMSPTSGATCLARRHGTATSSEGGVPVAHSRSSSHPADCREVTAGATSNELCSSSSQQC
jgi:hypothetical protein